MVDLYVYICCCIYKFDSYVTVPQLSIHSPYCSFEHPLM